MRRGGWLPALSALALLARGAAAEPAWVRTAVAESPALADSGPAAVVLEDATRIELKGHLTAVIRRRRVLRLLTPAGLDDAGFAFGLPPGGTLRSCDAWTLGAGGRSLHAGRNDVVERSVLPDMYTDARQVGIAAPDPRLGDVVAFECTYDEPLVFPFYTWQPQDSRLAVRHAELALAMPAGWRIETHSSGMTLRPAAEPGVQGFSAGPLPSLPDEPMGPGIESLLPRVLIRFVGSGDPTSFSSWDGFAAWYRLACAPWLTPAGLGDLGARATGTGATVALAALAREVQHSVSYAAIELGAGGWVPDPAADTWQRRYGDCKDKAVLLVAALATRGIVARPVVTCTRDHGDVDTAAVDPLQFNHAIVAVRWPGPDPPRACTATVRGRSWTFFDPTDPGTPLGLLPGGDAGAWGVIADSAGGLVRLPDAIESRIRNDIHARLDPDGALTGTLHIEWSGPDAGWLEARFHHATGAELAEHAPRLDAGPGTSTEITRARWLAYDSTAFAASMEMEFRIAGAARRAGDALVLRTPVLRRWRDPPPSDSGRTTAIVTGGPLRAEDRVSIELPPDFETEQVPEVRDSCALGSYALTRADGPGLTLVRRLVLRFDRVPAARFAEVKGLWRAAYDGDNSAIVLRRR